MISEWRNVGNKWSWHENEWTCPVEELGVFTGKLVFRVVLTVRIQLILMVGFRVQAETSHFCKEIQHVFQLLCEEAERKLAFVSQGNLG